jgi:hypothetical protein
MGNKYLLSGEQYSLMWVFSVNVCILSNKRYNSHFKYTSKYLYIRNVVACSIQLINSCTLEMWLHALFNW